MEEGTSNNDNVTKSNSLLKKMENFLPFLKKIIDCSHQLKITDDNLQKLLILYEMTESKKFPDEQLVYCEQIMYGLYNKYHKLIEQDEIFKNNSEELVQKNEDENKTKSFEKKLTSNKNDQKLNSESEESSKLIISEDLLKNKSSNNNINDLKYANESNNDSIIKSPNSLENDNLNDSLLTKIDLPKFSDSRLRLNKVIGFAVNASIEKLNNYDTTISHSEIAKKIYDDINKHKNDAIICKNMLKGINMNNIDVNVVKEVIENLKRTNTKSIQPVQLPLLDLINLKATNEMIQSSESNEKYLTSNLITPVSQPYSSVLSKPISVREKLNSDMDVLYKIDSSNKPNQYISMLKPSTLIDLQNSKVPCTPININSSRPVIRSSEKSTDVKPLVDIGVPRDPRIRNKLLPNSVNSTPIPSLLQPDYVSLKNNKSISDSKNNSFLTSHLNKVSQQEISYSKFSGYNEPINVQSMSVNTNMQSLSKQLPIEQGKNLNVSQSNSCMPLIQHQYKHNYNTVNDSQKKEMRNYESVSSNTNYRKRNYATRDPRLKKNFNERIHEPNYYSYKEYREAKQKTIEKQNECKLLNSKKDQEYSKSKYSNIHLTDHSNLYNSFGVSNDTVCNKKCKIPKIKHIVNTNDNKQIKSTTLKAGINSKIDTIKDNMSNHYNTKIIKDKIDKDTKTEIDTNVSVKKDLTSVDKKINKLNDKNLIDSNINNIKTQSNYVFGEHKKKPKKPKKYTNEKTFEKIVKEAVSSSSDSVHGPITRTRSSFKKKEKMYLNNEENNIITENKKNKFEECKNIDNESFLSIKNPNELNDIGHNFISSTSEKLIDIDSSEEIISGGNKDKIVSLNEINSMDDELKVNPNHDNFLSMLNNPEILSVINYLHENPNHLNELVRNTNVSKFKNKYISNIKHLNINKQKKLKKKMKKERRKRRKIKKIIDSEDKLTENEKINNTNTIFKPDENNLNEKDLSLKPVFVQDHYDSSNDQNELKDNFKILEDKAKLRDLKIVITKYNKLEIDKALNISCNIQAPNQPIKNNTIKPKEKPCPLSVKLAKQEKVGQNSENKINKNIEIKLQTNKQIISRKTKKISMKNLKNDEGPTLVNVTNQTKSCVEQPNVVLKSIDSNSGIIDKSENTFDKNLQKGSDLKKQNSNEITIIVPNVSDSKSEIKKPKPRMTELDKLHADINENCAAILNVSNIRHCRNNKQNYNVNSNILSQKSNSISIIKPDVFKIKKKKTYKSKGKLNKNKHLVQKKNTKDIGSLISSNNLIINKKTKVSKSSNNFDNQVNIKQVTEVLTTKILMDNDYKDKLYFQTGNNSLECKFCYYNDTELNMVRHYVEQHNEEEVLPSRLSKDSAEILINESLKENFGYRNFEDLKLFHRSIHLHYSFTCVFCQFICYDITQFYDHISSHTGEYRYKCQICSKTYPNKDEFEIHIYEHSIYIKDDENKYKLHPNIIQSNKVFGYLCSFCYYVQLTYINIVKHMSSRHIKEDKKFNGHWTIIRISMTAGYEDCSHSIIDYTKLVGCLPPIEDKPMISKEFTENKIGNELEVKYSTILNQTNLNSPNETKIDEDTSGFEYMEYTLKDNIRKYTIAGLSCELIINSVLLYRCSVSRCELNQFSTVILMDFVKHIELNHQHVIWDKKCDICKYEIENTEEYFLKDALKHIMSNHLVLKKNEEPVIYLENKESLPSINKDILQNTTKEQKSKKLTDRKLPGDILSIPDQTNINNVPTDLSFPALDPPIVDVIKLKKLPKSKTSKMYNNDGMSMWMNAKTLYKVILPNLNTCLEPGQQIVNNGQPIQGTYCLIDTEYKKYYAKKVRELPLNMLKTRLALTDMLTVPRVFGLFKCMDRTCTKIFTDQDLFKLHMKLHFSNSDKKKKSQMGDQFKMCAYCFKTFDDEDSLANHIVEKYTFCVYFCPNCFYRAYTASHVLVHQSMLHSNINPSILKLEYDRNENTKELLMAVDFNKFILPYVCNTGHCTYSCYIRSDFISHLEQVHQQCDKFCCYICAKNDNGEGFFAHQPKLIMKHLKLHAINLYQCIFCLFGTEVIDSMIIHLAMEHFEYDSICIERSLVINCYDATKIENLKIIKVQKSIDNGLVNVIKLSELNSLPKTLSHETKKRCLEHSDVLSSTMKSVEIDDNQSPDTIVIMVPDRAQMENNTSLTQSIDNEFNMLNNNVNQNSVQSSIKINNIWIKSKVNESMSHKSSDVIIIDDEDDILGNDNIEIFNKRCLTKHRIETSEKSKRLVLPIIPLNELFVCKECDLTFSTNDQFKNHLLEGCPFWNSNDRKCMFCSKSFKNIKHFFEHTLLHGPDRFKCSFCNIAVPSDHAIGHHMKTAHDITKYKLVPVNENEFIVHKGEQSQNTSTVNLNFICSECPYSDSTKKLILSHMKDIHNIEENNTYQVNLSPKNNFMQEYQMQKVESNDVLKSQQQTGTKRIRILSNNIDGETNSSKSVNIENKKLKLCFSPNNIESIPMAHIFSEPIGCLLCTYITKVRSNLIIHLNGHNKGQDNTSKEIVNPVPSIGKSELMFDKMINLSASSFEAMNTEKMIIDEINMKIVEIHDLDLNKELYPTFIPKDRRYKCSIPLCDFLTLTEDMLTKHISILHSYNHSYLCPHCKSESQTTIVELNKIEFHLMHHGENLYKCEYCDYIDFNKDEMKIHMRHTHLSQITSTSQSNIFVIRKLMLKDDIIDRHRYQVAAQWICNICSSGIKYTENEITSHIFMAHNVSNMFKCPMCKFEHNDDNEKVFEDHYKLNHPSVAVKCLKVFERITDVEELLPKQTNQFTSVSNIQKQQALESIEPTLVPPTCRGIPVESISINKSYNKSRGVSKSKKKIAKKTQIQVRKQNILVDNFKEDSLGSISADGLFTCPKCNVFETTNKRHFREHLNKDINYKPWKCLICSKESDSQMKMAWHVKKHGIGFNKYEKVENIQKLKWVDRVIKYQNSLISKLIK